MRLREQFEEDKIWRGWDTKPEILRQAASAGKIAHSALTEVIGLTDDPADLLTAIKSKLVDGRDFLENSKIVNQKNEFKKLWEVYLAIAEESKDLKLNFDESTPLEDLNPAIDDLVANAAKFKSWSEWVSAKEVMDGYQLQNLTTSLEARTILPDDAEQQVLTAFCRWLAPQLIDESDELRQFKASTHEQLIDEFRKLDMEVSETTSEYIAAIAAETIPDPFAKDSPKEFGLLARELQKKTRHKPVRSLFKEMGKTATRSVSLHDDVPIISCSVLTIGLLWLRLSSFSMKHPR